MTTKHDETSQTLSYSSKISAVAGSVSALYMLPVAVEAAIIHQTTPISIEFWGPSENVSWDVDGDTQIDFNLFAFNFFGTYPIGPYSTLTYFSSGGLGFSSNGLNGRGMVQLTGDNTRDVRNLPLGFTVPPNSPYTIGPYSQARSMMRSWNGINYVAASAKGFSGDGEGTEYIGFQFVRDSQGIAAPAFGWAEIDLDLAAGSMTILQWAYEDSVGPIDVGQTSAVPLPSAFLSMLSGLALGAGGLLRARRQRRTVQDQETCGQTFEHT